MIYIGGIPHITRERTYIVSEKDTQVGEDASEQGGRHGSWWWMGEERGALGAVCPGSPKPGTDPGQLGENRGLFFHFESERRCFFFFFKITGLGSLKTIGNGCELEKSLEEALL